MRSSRFVKVTAYRTTAEVEGKGYALQADVYGWGKPDGVSWRAPLVGGKRPSAWEKHPVVLVSHADAMAFGAWAGAALPTEAQFERAIRGDGEDRVYPWGDSLPVPKGAGNYAGDELKRAFPKWFSTSIIDYDDGYMQTGAGRAVPLESLRRLRSLGQRLGVVLGLVRRQVLRRVARWRPLGPGSGSVRAVRGGSWYDDDVFLRASIRSGFDPSRASGNLGFRLARSL